MPLQPTEYSCPTCKQAGLTNQIVANAGELLCTGNGMHKWNDTQSFKAAKPIMEFKVAAQLPTVQEHYRPMQLMVPQGLPEALVAKFGDKTGPTAASILMQMLEGRILIVGQTDLDRIKLVLGKEPTSAGELFGMIYAKDEEVKDYKAIADTAKEDLKAYEGMTPNRVMIDLGDQIQQARDLARGAEMPLKLWAEKCLKDGISNGWF